MKTFDWHRMALDKVPVEFLAEVALRSLYTFVLVFIFLKRTGRRGVRQMSLFEVLIILTLGSAAGDVAFYDDVPMLPVLAVFITLALLYRLIMWLMGHSEKLEDLLEGKPIIVVETNGQISLYFYEDDDVKAGLSILPSRFTDRFTTIPRNDEYACVRCSAILTLRAGDKQLCPRCANAEWSKVSRAKRVT